MNIAEKISKIVANLYAHEVAAILTRPDPKYGEYSTNVAMQLAGKLGNNPREIAEQIVAELKKEGLSASVAGAGFINIHMSDKDILESLNEAETLAKPLNGQVIVVEYSDPNPFKILHAGHLYTSVVGDCIANLYETAGATVHRVNFGGDVGRHVAQTMWAILHDGIDPAMDEAKALEQVRSLEGKSLSERSSWLAERYISGTNAFENDEEAKAEVVALNKKVYAVHDANDHESNFAQIYWTARQWSYDYFDEFYAQIGTKFEKYYPESLTAQLGLKTVTEQLAKGVFKESDGAVVFDGEKYGLHTRVFINSEGLPTYEAKDIGLSLTKWKDYKFDQSVMITGNDISEYMKVVLKALEQFEPEIAQRSRHVTHGIVKLAGGEKMSSRKGNILRAVDVLEAAKKAAAKVGQPKDEIVLGAVKYAFLKHGIGGDIHYDPDEAVATVGNSGPYLQYAHARACSILAKSSVLIPTSQSPIRNFEADERELAAKITHFPETVTAARNELAPQKLCTYLYELAQVFNSFYEKNKVVGNEREGLRLYLVGKYAAVLKSGLNLLGIQAPEKM